MSITGYEGHEVDRVEEILDANPSRAEEVYKSTIAFDPRAIAAVAAKRSGGGGSSPISVDSTNISSADLEDKALSIGHTTFNVGALTGGDGTLTVRVFYSTIDGVPSA